MSVSLLTLPTILGAGGGGGGAEPTTPNKKELRLQLQWLQFRVCFYA